MEETADLPRENVTAGGHAVRAESMVETDREVAVAQEVVAPAVIGLAEHAKEVDRDRVTAAAGTVIAAIGTTVHRTVGDRTVCLVFPTEQRPISPVSNNRNK